MRQVFLVVEIRRAMAKSGCMGIRWFSCLLTPLLVRRLEILHYQPLVLAVEILASSFSAFVLATLKCEA